MGNSAYVLQKAEGSTCPICLETLLLLCPRNGANAPGKGRPSFYICPKCQRAAEVGVGPVPRGDKEDIIA